MENRVIYCLIDENNTPFYIGKSYVGSTRKYNHTGTYPGCKLEIIDEVPVGEWVYWEKYWIEQFRQWGFKLKNKNNGGGGPPKGTPKPEGWMGFKGKTHTQEYKDKMSKIHKGNEYMKGKTHTQETKNSMSKIHRGNEYRKGVKLSKEIKQKMSMAHKDIPLSKQHKRNISDAMMGHTKDEKWKENLSKSATESFGKPILQLDLEGNLIKEWKTGKIASQELNIGYSAINQCCVKNKRDTRYRDKDKVGKYTSHSYIWVYKQVI